jgi:hypothetical protein
MQLPLLVFSRKDTAARPNGPDAASVAPDGHSVRAAPTSAPSAVSAPDVAENACPVVQESAITVRTIEAERSA